MREAPEHAAALRIGLLTHSVLPRGGVVHTLELAEALHSRGHDVTVMAPALPGQAMFRAVNCALHLVPVAAVDPGTGLAGRVGARIAAFERHLSQRLPAQPFDVLHAQDPIGANALARLRERGLVGGFVRTVHHLDHFDDPQLTAWQQHGMSAADRVLCVSRWWREHLSAAHGVEADQVPNGVDCDRYNRHIDARDAQVAQRLGVAGGARVGAPVFLSVGGIEERKNTLRLLEAFIAVRRQWPHAQWVIAGGSSLLDHDAYAGTFRAALARSGLAVGPGQAIVITGPVDDADMPALYRGADVLVMASLREGFGLAVLEALACGTPTVVSAVPPFTEHLGDADTGWADPLDAGSIARAMQGALAPGRRAALAAGVPEVCRQHSWDASALRHLEVYRRFLMGRHALAGHRHAALAAH